MKSQLTLILSVILASHSTAQIAASDRFKQLDRNGDGKLSAEEVASFPGLARLFSTLDSNRDGTLSRDEIRAATARFPGLAALFTDSAGSGAQSPQRGTLERVPAMPVTGVVAEFALEESIRR